jgi:hypothetical protein
LGIGTGDQGIDYANPTRSCDIVMKGGITSGVVYPHAVCELAPTYRFRNVGGTSAGAIAAAATAAAEYGRASGGFGELEGLPKWLGEGENLQALFQPQKATERPFAVLMAKVSGGWPRAARVAVCNYWLPAAGGAVPGLLLTAALVRDAARSGSWLALAVAILLTLVSVAFALAGASLAVVAALGLHANRAISDNDFGMCSGAPGDEAGGPPALTPWLTALLNRYAALPEEEPLTFGHLWVGPDGDRANPPVDSDDRFLTLSMMTTNLTNRKAHQLPWTERDWFFDPDEMRRLLPGPVVDWMLEHVPDLGPYDGKSTSQRSRMRLALAREQGLLPLPAAADIPVILATRMSLSFPVLLSAVPLWRYDMTREDTKDLLERWRRWGRDQGTDWDPLAATMAAWTPDGQPLGRPQAECCWFSDGGISSNFPVHFFDRLVPRWPTFAINLRPFPFGEKPDPKVQANNTWMVADNTQGSTEWWYRLPVRPRSPLRDTRLADFLLSAVKTMQNRIDEGQMRVPGYRDRVAHINMGDDEGGMNLAMDEGKIEVLTGRGKAASKRLLDAYTPPDEEGQVITWDNHRWVRFRSSIAVLEQMTCRFAEGFDKPPLRSDEKTYVEIFNSPPSYPIETDWQRQLALDEVNAVRTLGEQPTLERSMAKGAPNPAPVGRIVPRD